MSPKPAGTDSTAIKVRLSKDQVSMIWPGLNYIICQFLTREQCGQSVSSYPFRIQLRLAADLPNRSSTKRRRRGVPVDERVHQGALQ